MSTDKKATESDEKATDKVAIENTKEALSSLSKMTYLAFGILLPLLYVIASQKPDLDLGFIKIDSQYLPLIVFPAIYGILMHASRCLSIVKQLTKKERVATIGQDAEKALRTLVMTYEWPLNPFADFAEESKTKEDMRTYRWVILISYVPFLIILALCNIYILLIKEYDHATKILAIIGPSALILGQYWHYQSLVGTMIDTCVMYKDETMKKSRKKLHDEVAHGLMIISVLTVIACLILVCRSDVCCPALNRSEFVADVRIGLICFRMPFAGCLDLILVSTGKCWLVTGIYQIS